MLDDNGLIHMNGRVYDPTAGRFLSADLFIQAPTNTQSYNRYSYVFNNPLSFTDPSGYLTCNNDGSICTTTVKDVYTPDDPCDAFCEEGRLQEEEQREEQKRLDELYNVNNAFLCASGLDCLYSGFNPHGEVYQAINSKMQEGAVTAGSLAVPLEGAARLTLWIKNLLGLGKVTRGLAGLSRAQIKTVLISAQAAKKGSTVVGHALSKHAARSPATWGKMTGSMKTWNNQAMKHLREIIRGSGDFKQVTSKGNTFLEKRLDDGRGVRLNIDLTFKTFLD